MAPGDHPIIRLLVRDDGVGVMDWHDYLMYPELSEDDDIPDGYCQCGCGNKTNISTKNHKANGHQIGKPYRYVFGHQGKVENHKSYPTTKVPSHHKADEKGRVRNHILVAEKVFGKPLPPDAVVHHVDGDLDNNSPSNLVICQDRSYHRIIHARELAFRISGHASWRQCKYCHEYDDPINLYIPHSNKYAMHRSCNARYHRDRRRRLKNANHPL